MQTRLWFKFVPEMVSTGDTHQIDHSHGVQSDNEVIEANPRIQMEPFEVLMESRSQRPNARASWSVPFQV